MNGWQVDIFDGDFVRLITADEYLNEFEAIDDSNLKVLEKYGGKAYQVTGASYNGKILLEPDTCFAYPAMFLRPWHKDVLDGELEGEISQTDFENLIGASYE